jgi:hypothetical protein
MSHGFVSVWFGGGYLNALAVGRITSGGFALHGMHALTHLALIVIYLFVGWRNSSRRLVVPHTTRYVRVKRERSYDIYRGRRCHAAACAPILHHAGYRG